jgi:hypothetical protein
MEKKSLPKEGLLDLHFDADTFTLLATKTIKSLDIEVKIHLKDSKAIVKVRLFEIIPPGKYESIISSTKTLNQIVHKNVKFAENLHAYNCAASKMYDHIESKAWRLYGIAGGKSERHIYINVYPEIGSSYAFGLRPEEEILQHLERSAHRAN